MQHFWDVDTADIFKAMYKLWAVDKEIKHLYRPTKRSEDRLAFKPFMEFCRKNNFKATIQVSTQGYFDKKTTTIIPLKTYKKDINDQKILETGVVSWDLIKKAAEYAGAQVKWVKNNNYSDLVKYWEIGNEEFARIHMNVKFSGEEYGKLASMFIKEMKKADPSIKIIVTNSVPPSTYTYSKLKDWSKDVMENKDLKALKNDIFAFSNHFYPPTKSLKDNSFDAFKYDVVDNLNLDLVPLNKLHKDMIDESGYNNAVVFFNEYNSNHYLNPFTYSWLGALGNAKMSMSCANSPACYHADYYYLMHVHCTAHDEYENKGFGMIHFAKDFSQRFISYPVANVFTLLNKNYKGSILKTLSANKNIYVSTVNDKGNIRIIILTFEPVNLKLDLSEFNNLSYKSNESLGIDVPATFIPIKEGVSCSNPSEVKVLNILKNSIKVNNNGQIYSLKLPQYVLAVFEFTVK